MLEFQEINAATYTSLRRSILKKMEEPREEVYFDLTIKDKQGNIISEDGDPTIGIGIDIRKEEGREFAIGWMFGKYTNVGIKPDSDFRQDVRSAVAENSSYQTATSLQARLNQIMAARSGDSSAKFAFDDAAEMDRAFDQMADTIYEKKIDEWIRQDSNLPSDSIIKNSYERLALFSIVFNGGKGTLGSALKKALWNDDRPEAWYQIRYRTNKNQLPGLAKRRYFESQLFGLYEDRLTTGVTAEESAAVISMYNKHGSAIKAYDAKYSRQVERANVELVIPNLTPKVQGIAESIGRARQTTIDTYIPAAKVNQILISSGLGDVLVGAASKNPS